MTVKRRVWVNVFRQGRHVLVAICDSEILGKTLVDGPVEMSVSRDFYGGSLVEVDDAINILSQATTANFLGSNAVAAAVECGLVHPDAVSRVAGIPHAMFVRF